MRRSTMGRASNSNSNSNCCWVGAADAATWYCAAVVVALVLLSSFGGDEAGGAAATSLSRGRPCEEIYVVGEGETLHSISDKCGDPFIVERNPHIHDPDDVFPGLVIKITPLPLTLNHGRPQH